MKTKYDVIIPIGMSGSGKSTWIKNTQLDGYEIVSPDDIRRELTGNISDQTQNRTVFNIAYARMFQILDNGGSVIFDATNVNTKLRREFEQKVWRHKPNAKIGYKLFDADIQLSYERICNDIANKVDRSNVPIDVLQKQYQNYLQTIKMLNDENIENVDN